MTDDLPPNTMGEVRRRVNALDLAIVPLLVARGRCMHDAARIKQHVSEVRDEQRIEDIVERVRALAKEFGGDPDLIENLYREMMEVFIAYEMQLFSIKADDV